MANTELFNPSFSTVLPTKRVDYFGSNISLDIAHITELFDRLLHEFPHATERELHRLGLMILGMHTSGDNTVDIRPRDDGVLPGTDLYIFPSAQHETSQSIDWDGGRLSVREVLPQSSAYVYHPSNGIISFNDSPVFTVLPYPPIKPYGGPYYLRTNRHGSEKRLCLNPNPNCYSNCLWCARTYPQRRELDDLPSFQITPPDNLMQAILSDRQITADRSLESLEEISLVTGDFPKNTKYGQAEYLYQVLVNAHANGFNGSWYYSGHQICTLADFDTLARLSLSGTYVYTLEHFMRRKELMPVKGLIGLEEVSEILDMARANSGWKVAYSYVTNLDDMPTTKSQLIRFKNIAEPHISVFSPYAPDHEHYAVQKNPLIYLREMLELQRFIIETFGRPISSGSNRGLFSPRCWMDGDKVHF